MIKKEREMKKMELLGIDKGGNTFNFDSKMLTDNGITFNDNASNDNNINLIGNETTKEVQEQVKMFLTDDKTEQESKNRLREKLLDLTEEEKKDLFEFMAESIDFDYVEYENKGGSNFMYNYNEKSYSVLVNEIINSNFIHYLIDNDKNSDKKAYLDYVAYELSWCGVGLDEYVVKDYDEIPFSDDNVIASPLEFYKALRLRFSEREYSEIYKYVKLSNGIYYINENTLLG